MGTIYAIILNMLYDLEWNLDMKHGKSGFLGNATNSFKSYDYFLKNEIGRRCIKSMCHPELFHPKRASLKDNILLF